MLGVVEAESLAYASAHQHPVDGMAQPALGNYDDECQGRVASASGVGSPHGAERVGQRSGAVGGAGKQRLDRCGRTEALFLV